MAIVTKALGSAHEPEGIASVEIDYDDVDLRVRTLRVINDHPTFSFFAYVGRSSDGLTYSTTVSPVQTLTVNVPTNPAQRLQLTVNPTNGRLDGVGVGFNWVLP